MKSIFMRKYNGLVIQNKYGNAFQVNRLPIKSFICALHSFTRVMKFGLACFGLIMTFMVNFCSIEQPIVPRRAT